MSKIKKVTKKIKEGYIREAIQELKWIFNTAKDYRILIFVYCILQFGMAFVSLFLSVKSKELVDQLTRQNWRIVFGMGIVYLAIGAINVIMAIAKQMVGIYASSSVKKNLSNTCFENIVNAKWESIVGLHSGDIITRMNDDISIISNSVVGWIPEIIVSGIKILIAIIIIVYYDFTMIIMVIAVAPIIILGSRIFLGKVYEKNKAQRIVASKLTTFEKETFQNIHMIKAFGLGNSFTNKMSELQKDRQEIDIVANKYSVASWAVMYISGQVAAVICLAWALFHVYSGVLTLGTLVMMAVLASHVSSSFKSLIDVIPNAMSTIASAQRVQGLMTLDAEHDIEVIEEEFYEEGKKHGMNVKIDNVAFSYNNGKAIFENVSFNACTGEIIALVGPSGEGKTTMLRLLLGIIYPKSGGIYIEANETAISKQISPSLRCLISYVPQGNTIMNGTIAENMRVVKPKASDEEIISVLKKACAYDFVENLPGKINYAIGEGGIGFSEGQNQRLAIARALLCDAPILLLDEATSALDVATERKVLQNLMETDGKRTCILTTHRPSVLSMCNRVYKIADKKIRQITEEEITDLMNEF